MGQALTSWLRSKPTRGPGYGATVRVRKVRGRHESLHQGLPPGHCHSPHGRTAKLSGCLGPAHTHGEVRRAVCGSCPAAPCPAVLAGDIPVVQPVDILRAAAAAAPPPSPARSPRRVIRHASHTLPLTRPDQALAHDQRAFETRMLTALAATRRLSALPVSDMVRAGLMSACSLSKLLHSAAWSGLPWSVRRSRPGTSPRASSLAYRCSSVAAGRLTAALASCRSLRYAKQRVGEDILSPAAHALATAMRHACPALNLAQTLLLAAHLASCRGLRSPHGPGSPAATISPWPAHRRDSSAAPTGAPALAATHRLSPCSRRLASRTRRPPRPPAAAKAAASVFLRRQWERPGGGGANLLGLLDRVSVRHATAHLTASHTAARGQRLQGFVQLALRPAGTPLGAAAECRHCQLPQGHAGSLARPLPKPRPQRPLAGGNQLPAGRVLQPVALPVRCAGGGASDGTRAHPRPPSAAVKAAPRRSARWIWALGAMEHGLTGLWARLASEANSAAQDTEALVSASLAAVGAAGRLAAARFWSFIEEFAHNVAEVQAFEGLGADHPFLCHRAGRVEVHLLALAGLTP
eukprot:364557-Chlamydomonas_euryale.AAC.1